MSGLGLGVWGLGLQVPPLAGPGPSQLLQPSVHLFPFEPPSFLREGLGFGVQGSGFRVQGSGFSVQGSGFRVHGLGFSQFHGVTL